MKKHDQVPRARATKHESSKGAQEQEEPEDEDLRHIPHTVGLTGRFGVVIVLFCVAAGMGWKMLGGEPASLASSSPGLSDGNTQNAPVDDSSVERVARAVQQALAQTHKQHSREVEVLKQQLEESRKLQGMQADSSRGRHSDRGFFENTAQLLREKPLWGTSVPALDTSYVTAKQPTAATAARDTQRGQGQANGSIPYSMGEQHHHVLNHYFNAALRGDIPKSGNVLFHIDSHADMHIPTATDPWIVHFLQDMLTDRHDSVVEGGTLNFTMEDQLSARMPGYHEWKKFASPRMMHFFETSLQYVVAARAIHEQVIMQKVSAPGSDYPEEMNTVWKPGFFPKNKKQVKKFTKSLDIGDWVFPLVMTGLVDHVIWVRPDWPISGDAVPSEFNDPELGDYLVKFGYGKDGRVCSTFPGVLVHGNVESVCSEQEMTRARIVRVQVMTLETAVRIRALKQRSMPAPATLWNAAKSSSPYTVHHTGTNVVEGHDDAAPQGRNVLLDIDLDYFSTWSSKVYEELFDDGYHNITEAPGNTTLSLDWMRAWDKANLQCGEAECCTTLAHGALKHYVLLHEMLHCDPRMSALVDDVAGTHRKTTKRVSRRHRHKKLGRTLLSTSDKKQEDEGDDDDEDDDDDDEEEEEEDEEETSSKKKKKKDVPTYSYTLSGGDMDKALSSYFSRVWQAACPEVRFLLQEVRRLIAQLNVEQLESLWDATQEDSWDESQIGAPSFFSQPHYLASLPEIVQKMAQVKTLLHSEDSVGLVSLTRSGSIDNFLPLEVWPDVEHLTTSLVQHHFGTRLSPLSFDKVCKPLPPVSQGARAVDMAAL